MKYISPELTYIGKLENLTTGGSGRKRESSVSKSKGKNKDSNDSNRRP